MSKDTIYRQAAIDALGEEPMVWTDSDYEIAQRNQWNVDKLAIETVPSAEPERKKGKWTDQDVFDVDENGGRIIEEWQSARCSVCGKYHTTPYMYYFDIYKFCPNCGARMNG